MKRNLLIFIVVFVSYFLGNSIYTEITRDKTPGKAKRIPCQAKVTTFEKCFLNDDIKIAQSLLESGNIHLSSSVKRSVYSKSKLFDIIKLDDLDKLVYSELNSYIKRKKETKDKLNLSYYVYENDPKDPGKKTEKSKLYGGYILLQVKNKKDRTIYKVQIDFMDKQGKDLKQSLKCCIKSFATYNK